MAAVAVTLRVARQRAVTAAPAPLPTARTAALPLLAIQPVDGVATAVFMATAATTRLMAAQGTTAMAVPAAIRPERQRTAETVALAAPWARAATGASVWR